MEIIENNAIKLRVKNPSAVTNAIRKSTILEDGDVLVHWGIKEAQVLKGLGIDIPSPINTYEWTGKHKARMERQRARRAIDKKGVDKNKNGKADKREGKDVAHKKALSKGGTNKDGYTIQSKRKNRSFKRKSDSSMA